MIAGFISAELKMENDFTLELQLKKETILSALVSKINQDVVSKMEQDVELLGIDLVKANALDIQGGFLVQKGFGIFESKIREKIESSAKIELGKAIKALRPALPIPGNERKLTLEIEYFDLSTLQLVPNDAEMRLSVVVGKAGMRVC